MLAIDNIMVRIAGREILSGATANLPAGRRIGLVGRNGAGKSTLFKVILGQLQPDDGQVSWPSAWRVGAVAQEAPGTDVSLLDTVLEADTERTASAGPRPSTKPTATSWATSMPGWRRSTPIPRRPAPPKFWPAWVFRPKTSFGPAANSPAAGACAWRWRRSCSRHPICCCWTSPPTISISKACCGWRISSQRYRGTILIVSHDRDLLNTACEFILHLERGKLKLYTGNYDTFVETRAAKRALGHRLRQEAGSGPRAYAGIRRPLPRQGLQGAPRRKAASRCWPRWRWWKCRRTSMSRPSAFPTADAASPPLITMDRASVGYEAGQADPHRPVASASIPTTASRCWARTATANPPWRNCWPASSKPWAASSRRRASWWWAISPSISRKNSTCHHADRNPVGAAAENDHGSKCAASWAASVSRPTRR